MNEEIKKTTIEFADKYFTRRYGDITERLDREIQIKFCAPGESMADKRLSFTKDEVVRKIISANKEKYDSTAGCVVVPPEEDVYTIILKEEDTSQLLAYNFCHELIHVLTLDDIRRIDAKWRWEQWFTNNYFTLWDEYNARYCSTRILIDWQEEISLSENIIGFFDSTYNCLRRSITDGNYEVYDGMQFCGYIAAFYDAGFIDDSRLEELLAEGNVKSVYRKYRAVKGVLDFV